MSELRFDPTTQKWSIIAPERCKRPSDFKLTSEEIKRRKCPFCPGNESLTPSEIYRIASDSNESGWRTRVVPNKYPALRVEEQVERSAFGVFDTISGVGAHEVIVDTDQHDLALDQYSDQIWIDLFTVFQSRMTDLKKDIRLRYALPIKNVGMAAGASLVHPHSQLVALPEIPPGVKQILHVGREYYVQKERCMYCDVVQQELEDRSRIVYENQDYVALCPYGSSFPFEIRIYPKQHFSDYTLMTQKQYQSLADITGEVFRRLYSALDEPSLNMYIHTVPIANDPLAIAEFQQWMDVSYHWHMVIIPRMGAGIGLEFGAGISVNPVPPEEAAAFLRRDGK